MIESALAGYLQGVARLAALVGSRIYPIILPQNAALPAIAYSRVSTSVERDLSGAVRTRARMQLTCFGTSYGSAKQVSREVRATLQDYTGQMGPVNVLEATVLGEMDEFEADLTRYYVPVDVIFLIEGGNA